MMPCGFSQSQRGFSLVELMVVVTIIGILAAIAVPRFSLFRARTQQTEAKSGLSGLYAAMESSRSSGATYPTTSDLVAVNGTDATTAKLSFATTGTSKYNFYVQVLADGTGFAAVAGSKAPMIGNNYDVWRTNTTKLLTFGFDGALGTLGATTVAACNAAAGCSVNIQPTITGSANTALTTGINADATLDKAP